MCFIPNFLFIFLPDDGTVGGLSRAVSPPESQTERQSGNMKIKLDVVAVPYQPIQVINTKFLLTKLAHCKAER